MYLMRCISLCTSLSDVPEGDKDGEPQTACLLPAAKSLASTLVVVASTRENGILHDKRVYKVVSATICESQQ
jgi:hypothetical protein